MIDIDKLSALLASDTLQPAEQAPVIKSNEVDLPIQTVPDNAPKTIRLNTDQQEALKIMLDLPLGSIFKLMGSAGTGKTTLVNYYLNLLNSNSVILTAPTHKAVEVLATKNRKYDCKTIHSFLALRPKLMGNKYVLTQELDMLSRIRYLVIDEASMIDSELYDYIIAYWELYRPTIIFLGDDKQLNPINEVQTRVFTEVVNGYTLTEVMRQDPGNDIIELSNNLDWLRHRKEGNNFTWSNYTWDQLIKANGTDLAKYIAWTNKRVTEVNNLVRSVIYGEKPEQFYVGETILITEHYEKKGNIIYRNNEEVIINSVAEVEIETVPCWLINEKIPLVQADCLQSFEAIVNTIKEAAQNKICTWADYYTFVKSFGSYQYNHAITVHRSQGSTYDSSYVDITNINSNPNRREKQKMLYTALTRARNHNYLI